MQIAVKRAPYRQISARKRRLLRFAVRKVLGTPSHWKQGNTRWLVWSDPTINRNDVRRLIAVISLIHDFPDVEPPDDWGEARALVKQWAASRLPDWPAGDGADWPPLDGWFALPWLRFDTAGMHPVRADGTEYPETN